MSFVAVLELNLHNTPAKYFHFTVEETKAREEKSFVQSNASIGIWARAAQLQGAYTWPLVKVLQLSFNYSAWSHSTHLDMPHRPLPTYHSYLPSPTHWKPQPPLEALNLPWILFKA